MTTFVFRPVKFDRVIKLVHETDLAVTVVNRQQPLARYSKIQRGGSKRGVEVPIIALIRAHCPNKQTNLL